MSWRQKRVALGGLIAIFVMAFSPLSYAQQSSSTNYQVNEVFMGSGGELNACSTNYCAKQSAGEIAAGHAAGNLFQAQGGFNTDRTPFIAVSASGGNIDLGVLSPFGAAYATATYSVKTYLASGYVVQAVADPPTSDGVAHQLNPLASPTASSPGTEQFGINMVNNTIGCGAPANFGADPVQVPSNVFSFGSAATGYNACGQFKYVKNDVVARSTKSSGQTDYTVSFLYNISNVTPDGLYTFKGDFVTTSTY